jgi:hypothetical protein
MPTWKFSCECQASIPLPPEYSFAQAFNYLNAEKNSFYILEHEKGNYIQCGGSKTACCVETRVYSEDGSYQHSVIGHGTGSDMPTAIQMSAGVVNVLKREVLSHWEAIELFKKFFAGEPFPEEFSSREVER